MKGSSRHQASRGEITLLGALATVALALGCWSTGSDVGALDTLEQARTQLMEQVPTLRKDLLDDLDRQVAEGRVSRFDYRIRKAKIRENLQRLEAFSRRLLDLTRRRQQIVEERMHVSIVRSSVGMGAGLRVDGARELVLTLMDMAGSAGEIGIGSLTAGNIGEADIQRAMEESGLTEAFQAPRDDLATSLAVAYVRGAWARANELRMTPAERERLFRGLAAMFEEEGWRIPIPGRPGQRATSGQDLLNLVEHYAGRLETQGSPIPPGTYRGELEQPEVERLQATAADRGLNRRLTSPGVVVEVGTDGTARLLGPLLVEIQEWRPIAPTGNRTTQVRLTVSAGAVATRRAVGRLVGSCTVERAHREHVGRAPVTGPFQNVIASATWSLVGQRDGSCLLHLRGLDDPLAPFRLLRDVTRAAPPPHALVGGLDPQSLELRHRRAEESGGSYECEGSQVRVELDPEGRAHLVGPVRLKSVSKAPGSAPGALARYNRSEVEVELVLTPIPRRPGDGAHEGRGMLTRKSKRLIWVPPPRGQRGTWENPAPLVPEYETHEETKEVTWRIKRSGDGSWRFSFPAESAWKLTESPR